MPGGFTGRILFVDLSTGEIKEERPDEKLYYDYLGGYGIGARIIYTRQKPGADPLGPENIFGFATGSLTGTNALFGCRYTIVGKSPLTGGWGDANSGGDFGPYLKFAGYDAVFFSGIAPNPVYLVINNGDAKLMDASSLWGKDTNETEEILRKEYGKKCSVACIGPSGEKMSFISCIINNEGRAAARSGLGAVMGAKKLKAVVAAGDLEVPVADNEKVNQQRRRQLAELKGPSVDSSRKYGTCAALANSAARNNAPTKNWGGSARVDFPNPGAISDDNIIKYEAKKFACWKCPLVCGGHMKAGTEYPYPEGAHKPEYETLAAFGTNCLVDNPEAIIMANDLCNRYGLDTISAGSVVAFAMECYENGIITKEDTGGIELNWGNHRAMIAMLEKVATREGIGDVLADGVAVAAKKLGKGTEKYAVHAGGQEPGMHDPKLRPALGTTYKMDPTPGRHMQGGAPEGPQSVATMASLGVNLTEPIESYVYTGKGDAHRLNSALRHVVNCLGLCCFGTMRQDIKFVPEAMSVVMGREYTIQDVLKLGERIANIRQAFNVREGLNSRETFVHGRLTGSPPMTYGPSQGITIDLDSLAKDMLEGHGWDTETSKPKREKLMEMGLDDVAEDLWSGE